MQIPTTVMGAIDASIGIKTAVNFDNRKNKMGTYCPPLAVFIDRTFLQTLDQRNLSNGAAEMLKMASVKDDALFHMLEEHGADFIKQRFQVNIFICLCLPAVSFPLDSLCSSLFFGCHFLL